MFRFVAIGDLHLEKLSFLPLKDPLSPTFDILEKIVSYCDDESIDTAVLLGDIFETPYPKQASIKRFLEFLNSHRQITWHIILGNHDFATTYDNSLEIADTLVNNMGLLKNVHLYTEPVITVINDVSVGFFPYPHYQVPATKTSRLCFGHFGTVGSKHDNGSIIHDGVDLDKLSKNDFWIMGHLHRYQELKRVVYPGTISQLTFGEPLPKYFLHVEATQTKKDLEVDYKAICTNPPYELHTVIIESEDDLKLISKDSNKYYKLFVKKGTSLPVNSLANYTNIIKILGYSTKKEQSSLTLDKLDIEECERSLSPTHDLDKFLDNTLLTHKQKKKAIDIVETLVKSLAK